MFYEQLLDTNYVPPLKTNDPTSTKLGSQREEDSDWSRACHVMTILSSHWLREEDRGRVEKCWLIVIIINVKWTPRSKTKNIDILPSIFQKTFFTFAPPTSKNRDLIPTRNVSYTNPRICFVYEENRLLAIGFVYRSKIELLTYIWTVFLSLPNRLHLVLRHDYHDID